MTFKRTFDYGRFKEWAETVGIEPDSVEWTNSKLAFRAGYEAGRAEQVKIVPTDPQKWFLTRKELAGLIDSYLFRKYNMNHPTVSQNLLKGFAVFLMQESE